MSLEALNYIPYAIMITIILIILTTLHYIQDSKQKRKVSPQPLLFAYTEYGPNIPRFKFIAKGRIQDSGMEVHIYKR